MLLLTLIWVIPMLLTWWCIYKVKPPYMRTQDQAAAILIFAMSLVPLLNIATTWAGFAILLEDGTKHDA